MCLYRQLNSKLKRIIVLLIISVTILPISDAIPVVLHERKLILHTQPHRQPFHPILLTNHHTQSAAANQRHSHHMNIRSVLNNYSMNRFDTTKNYDQGEEQFKFCAKVANILDSPLTEVQDGINRLWTNLCEFADRLYKKELIQLDKEMQTSTLNLGHPYSQDIEHNLFEVTNVEEKFKHILNGNLTDELITLELEKAITTMEVIRLLLKNIFEDVKTNENANIQEKIVETYFEQALRQSDIHNETINKAYTGLTRNYFEPLTKDEEANFLNAIQEVIHISDAYKRYWLVIREHMSVLRYLHALYKTIIHNCKGMNA